MKQVKEIIIDIESFFNIIKEKNTIIEHLDLQIKNNKSNFDLVINFLKNVSNEVFINDHKNIQNIEQIYTIICNFAFHYFNNSSFNDLGIKSIIEKIKDFTIYNAEKEIESSFKMEKINNSKMKHNFKILSFDEKRFNAVISNMIGEQIKKTGDFTDFDSKYSDIKLLKFITDPKKFFKIYKYFIGYTLLLERKHHQKVLLMKIINNVFKRINEDIKNKKLDPNDNDLISFSGTYIQKLKELYNYNPNSIIKKSNFNYKDFNTITKTFHDLYYYYLHNDPKISIVEYIGVKNDIIENRLVEKNNKQGIIKYLNNIFDELKDQNLTDEQIFKKMLNDNFKVIEKIKKTSHFMKFILFFEPKLEYLSYINIKNISIKKVNFENDDTDEIIYSRGSYDIKEDLIEKYLKLLKKNNYNLSDVINEYPDLLKILNSAYYFRSEFFVELYNQDEIEKNLNEIKKYENIYFACIIFNYQKLNVNDHFNIIKKDKNILDLFINSESNLFNVSKFLRQHEKEFPVVIDDFEELIDKSIQNVKILLLYFYVSRKKLSPQSEKIINSKNITKNMYNNLLIKINKNRSLGYKSLSDFENSLYSIDEDDLEFDDE